MENNKDEVLNIIIDSFNQLTKTEKKVYNENK